MPVTKIFLPFFLLCALAGSQAAHAQNQTALAQSPHVDCRRAGSATERTVCATPELRGLAEELANISRTVTAKPGLRAEALGLEATWRRQRDACGVNFGCLAAAYRDMMAMLRALDDPLFATPPATPLTDPPTTASVGNTAQATPAPLLRGKEAGRRRKHSRVDSRIDQNPADNPAFLPIIGEDDCKPKRRPRFRDWGRDSFQS